MGYRVNTTDTLATWWPSPAKLNLFLHINGRRSDGFHELQSVFQMLSYGDELAFEVTHEPSICMHTPLVGVADDDNLIIKAARALQKHCHCKLGCTIYLNKKLPMGGGIGGGSSNAATTLRVLNELWDCKLNIDQLAELGLALGADVPVFVHGHTAFAEGVGEILTPIAVDSKVYLVVFPNCHVATATIFGSPNLPRNTPKINAKDYQFDITQNDCQNLVIDQYSEVAKLLQWLLQFAPSRMTGTGACVFAVFDDHEKAEQVFNKLPSDWHGFIAQGVDESPLNTALRAWTD